MCNSEEHFNDNKGDNLVCAIDGSVHSGKGASGVCAGYWRTASTAGGRGDDGGGSFMLWQFA
jgi:hypothetical protein